MMTGASYNKILPNTRKPVTKKGLVASEVRYLLETLTGVRWQTVYLSILPRRLDDFVFPDWPVLVIIRPPWRPLTWHSIVVKGDVVHDPAWEIPAHLGHYWFKGWRAVIAFQPAHRGIED